MPRQRPEPRPSEVGRRVSLRRVLPDGGQGDLLGFVIHADDERLRLRDRRGVTHEVPWSTVLAWRPVGVARGRDPLRTPLADLDRLAAATGASGRVFVARLSDLLDGRPPGSVRNWDDPPPCPARLDGEWVVTGECEDVLSLAWWAAHHGARSIQVRTADAGAAEELERLGFREVLAPQVPGQT